jgi:signal transduction histidine kinase
MNHLLRWIQQWVIQIAIGFLFGGCFLRFWIQYAHHPNQLIALILLAFWLILFIVEPLISKRWGGFFYLYLVLQTLILFSVLRNFPDNDNIAVLYAGLSMQIMYRLPPRIGICIIAVFTPLIMIGVQPYYDLLKTIPLAVIYTAANAFLGACAYSVRKAREEREREIDLYHELQLANQQLEESARNSEQLSVARERSRLALELHDSVTQTIFSMVLTTRAAVILVGQDPSRVANQLDHLDQLVRSALEELKKLIQELRPDPKSKTTLVGLLQNHTSRLGDENMNITIQSTGIEALSEREVQSLFRIAQESLNNVIKHAQTSSASIILKFTDPARMEIRDEGVGFDFDHNNPGVGLKGMKERAAGIGWTLDIVSKPGEGTLVVARKKEDGKGISDE